MCYKLWLMSILILLCCLQFHIYFDSYLFLLYNFFTLYELYYFLIVFIWCVLTKKYVYKTLFLYLTIVLNVILWADVTQSGDPYILGGIRLYLPEFGPQSGRFRTQRVQRFRVIGKRAAQLHKFLINCSSYTDIMTAATMRQNLILCTALCETARRQWA